MSPESPPYPKSIREEIATLRAMPLAHLVARYEELHGRPPRSKNRAWLWRRCAWKLQEARLGGLSQVARRRLEELIAEIDLPLGEQRRITASVPATTRPGEPPVGTELRRAWRGREIVATKTESGWAYDGVDYRSLSALARAVTGAHQSGRAFFGLAPIKRKTAK